MFVWPFFLLLFILKKNDRRFYFYKTFLRINQKIQNKTCLNKIKIKSLRH
jgi:hypothetical protein